MTYFYMLSRKLLIVLHNSFIIHSGSLPTHPGYEAALLRALLMAQVLHPPLVQERQSVPKVPLQSRKQVLTLMLQ